jgi:hypothetical protein
MLRNYARFKIAIRKAPMEGVLDPKSAEMIRHRRAVARSTFSLVQANPGSFGIIIIMVRSPRAAQERVTTAAFAAG